MQIIKKKTLFVLIITIAIICTAFICVNIVKNIPKNDRQLVFYANITSIEPLLNDFMLHTGMSIDYHRVSTSEFLNTILHGYQEDSFVIDIIQAPIPIMDMLANEGILKPYISPSAATLPEWAKRENDGIYKFAIEYVSIIFNSDMIDPDDVPRQYQDLTDPKWMNKIVMPDPLIHSTTISWLVALKEHVFEDDYIQWVDFLKGLAANKPLFVSSFTPTPTYIINGERPIGISMPKYIVSHEKSSLDWAKIEPIMGTFRGIGISSKTQNSETAKVFIDYWLSERAGRILANDVGEYVLVPGVYPPIEGMDKATVLPIKELNKAEFDFWRNEFTGIFNL